MILRGWRQSFLRSLLILHGWRQSFLRSLMALHVGRQSFLHSRMTRCSNPMVQGWLNVCRNRHSQSYRHYRHSQSYRHYRHSLSYLHYRQSQSYRRSCLHCRHSLSCHRWCQSLSYRIHRRILLGFLLHSQMTRCSSPMVQGWLNVCRNRHSLSYLHYRHSQSHHRCCLHCRHSLSCRHRCFLGYLHNQSWRDTGFGQPLRGQSFHRGCDQSFLHCYQRIQRRQLHAFHSLHRCRQSRRSWKNRSRHCHC